MKLAALLLLLGTLPCLANLGETEQQSVDRYGPPRDEKTFTQDGHSVTKLTFRKDGLVILAMFLDGKTCGINFSKESGEFSRSDAEAILNANADGLQWRIDPKKSDEKVSFWFRTDKGVLAAYLPRAACMLIQNSRNQKRTDLESKHFEAEKRRLRAQPPPKSLSDA